MKYDFNGMNSTELPSADEITYSEVKEVLYKLSNKTDNLSNLKRNYFKNILLYKRTEEKVILNKKITRKLDGHALGYFTKTDISKVLDLPLTTVVNIEKSVLRRIKHPKNTRAFKRYLEN